METFDTFFFTFIMFITYVQIIVIEIPVYTGNIVFLFTFLICINVKAGFAFNHAEARCDSFFKIIFPVFFVTYIFFWSGYTITSCLGIHSKFYIADYLYKLLLLYLPFMFFSGVKVMYNVACFLVYNIQ